MKLTRGLVAGGVALALALAGCSGEESGTPSGISGNGGLSGPRLFSNIDELVSAATEQSQGKQSAQLTFDMDFSGQKVAGSGAYRAGSNPAMKMSMDMGAQLGGAFEIILVDKALYMKLPEQLKGALGAGDKAWLKISNEGTDPISQSLGPLFDQMEQQADVSKALEKMKVAGEITNSEATTLDGQDVTHYWISVDYAKFAAAEQDPTLKKALETLAGQKIEQEVWLDSDNLPVQISAQIPVPDSPGSGTGAGTGSGKFTMKFSGWGEPVDITAPPADQIATPPTR